MCDEILKVALLDDDKSALPLICGSIESYFKREEIPVVIDSYDRYQDLYDACKKDNKKYNILFLDIEMPDISGIQVGKQIKDDYPSCEIIFLSNREDKVFDSLLVHPFGFIRKRSFFEDIDKVLHSYFQKKEEKKPEASITTEIDGNITSISVSDIVYIESQKRYQYIHLIDGNSIEAILTLNKFYDELKDKNFAFCHKSYLINISHIKTIEQDTILMTNGDRVYLSRRKQKEIKELFLKYLQSKKQMVLS